jgi:hypothetical protein
MNPWQIILLSQPKKIMTLIFTTKILDITFVRVVAIISYKRNTKFIVDFLRRRTDMNETFKELSKIEEFLVWMVEEYGTAETSVFDTKLWAEGTLDTFYRLQDNLESIQRESQLSKRESELLKEKMQRLCPHNNLEDGLYASNPPKKRCLDCGEFLLLPRIPTRPGVSGTPLTE